MTKITYEDKVTLNENASVPAINKCQASDMNEIKSVVNAGITQIETNTNDIASFNGQVAQGWYKTGLNPTLTFVSFDSSVYTGIVSSNIDLTPYIGVGMKVKFTQNSAVKYAFITAITSTQLTLFLGTDYSIDNSTITNIYFSMLKAPYGFPTSPDKWTVTKEDTTTYTQTPVTTSTWYNFVNTYAPVGTWVASITGIMTGVRDSGTGISIFSTLSTTNNSSTMPKFNFQIWIASTNVLLSSFYKINTISFQTKTQIFLNIESDMPGVNTVKLEGANSTTTIRLLCAYL